MNTSNGCSLWSRGQPCDLRDVGGGCPAGLGCIFLTTEHRTQSCTVVSAHLNTLINALRAPALARYCFLGAVNEASPGQPRMSTNKVGLITAEELHRGVGAERPGLEPATGSFPDHLWVHPGQQLSQRRYAPGLQRLTRSLLADDDEVRSTATSSRATGDWTTQYSRCIWRDRRGI